MKITSFIMNLIWAVLGGLLASILWAVFGLIWCCTIIGIPFGIVCFKMAGISLCPFGKDIVYTGRTFSVICDILWILLTGVELAIFHLVVGAILCCTIIGIPFGLQHFKIAIVAFLPFGSKAIY